MRIQRVKGNYESNSAISLHKAIIWLILALPLLVLVPGASGFPYPGDQGLYSDISITHYPYAVYLRQSILEQHRIPLWSNLIFSGSPFAANPLSGLWYPPGWIALLLPLPLGFNILIALHLFFGGLGVFKLLESEGLDTPSALFAGLAFVSLPKLFAHYGAGHLTLLYAIPWTPWLLLAGRSVGNYARTNLVKTVFSFEAPILALIFFADPRWATYAGLIWVAYRHFRLPYIDGIKRTDQFWQRLFGVVFLTCLTLLLVAPLAIPFTELTLLSTRSEMQPAEIWIYSLPIPRLLGIIFPDFHGFHEYMLYVGQIVILLLFAAIYRRPTRMASRFWIVIAVLSLVLALGENFPPLTWLGGLPLLGYLRVPSRALFVFGLSCCVLAGYGLQGLLNGFGNLDKRPFKLFLIGYAAFLTALAAGASMSVKRVPLNFAFGALWALILVVWFLLFINQRVSQRIWLAGLLPLFLADVGLMNASLFYTRPMSAVLDDGSNVVQTILNTAGDGNLFRIYSPSYSVPQQAAAVNDLQLSDGVDPLHLKSYSRFMEKASGIPNRGYSVSIPTYSSGNPSSDNQSYLPDSRLLGLLNVRYIASEFPLNSTNLSLNERAASTWIYANEDYRPRAWVEPLLHDVEANYNEIDSIDSSPNKISIVASGPGRLVLSEINYPGWRAWVDGEVIPIEEYEGILRMISLSSGRHEIVFTFSPTSLFVGLGIGVSGWLILLFAWVLYKWKH